MFKRLVMLKRKDSKEEPDAFPIQEIFESVCGEGPTYGLPAVFIRVAGCSRHCVYCDSGYVDQFESEKTKANSLKYSPNKLAELISSEFDLTKRHVCLTGGEPFLYERQLQALTCLLKPAYGFSVETNGELFNPIFQTWIPNVYTNIIISYKLTSSGKKYSKQIPDYIHENSWYHLKFVIQDENDVDEMLDLIEGFSFCNPIYLQPVHGNQNSFEAVIGFLSGNKVPGAPRFKQKCSSLNPLPGSPDIPGIQSNTGRRIEFINGGLQNEFRLSLQVHKMIDMP